MTTWFDRYSTGHFLLGSINYVVFKKLGVSDDVNFIITNTIHLLVECNEHPVDPNGNVLETLQNHLGDIISFFLGWLVSYYFQIDTLLWSGIYPFLYCALLGTFILEVGRELFPNIQWGLIRGAFLKYKSSIQDSFKV